jgi:CheY-like chemotaxis protein
VDKLTILVVEDDPLIQMDLEDALQSGGYETIVEASGESAIAVLESQLSLRALVTDINLSRQASGWDVARRAREIFPDLPVIYVTSVASEEWTSQGVPKSVLIVKPFAPAQIVTAVSQLLLASGEPPSVPVS